MEYQPLQLYPIVVLPLQKLFPLRHVEDTQFFTDLLPHLRPLFPSKFLLRVRGYFGKEWDIAQWAIEGIGGNQMLPCIRMIFGKQKSPFFIPLDNV